MHLSMWATKVIAGPTVRTASGVAYQTVCIGGWVAEPWSWWYCATSIYCQNKTLFLLCATRIHRGKRACLSARQKKQSPPLMSVEGYLVSQVPRNTLSPLPNMHLTQYELPSLSSFPFEEVGWWSPWRVHSRQGTRDSPQKTRYYNKSKRLWRVNTT